MLLWGLGGGDYLLVYAPVATVGFRGSGMGLGERRLSATTASKVDRRPGDGQSRPPEVAASADESGRAAGGAPERPRVRVS